MLFSGVWRHGRGAAVSQRAILALLGLYLCAGSAQAQTIWTGGTSTDWFTAGNWTAGVPNAGTSAFINDGVTFNPVIDAAGAAASEVWIGTFASVLSGTLDIDGAGTLTTPLFVVGDVGTGTATVSGGGVLTTGISSVGNNVGAVGTVTVTGENSTWIVNEGYFKIGDSGTGTLNVLDGGLVQTIFTLDVGADNTATGDVLVSGTDSRLEVGTANIGTSQNGILLATSTWAHHRLERARRCHLQRCGLDRRRHQRGAGRPQHWRQRHARH